MKQVLSQNVGLVLSPDAFILNHPSTIFTNDNITVNTFLTVDDCEKYLSVSLNASAFPTLPSVGAWVEEGRVYSYNDKMVKCIQSHTRMSFTPEETPALFSIFRVNNDTLQWIDGEKVFVDWIRVYKGKSYKCIQSHQTQISWNPELTLGTLWQVVATTSEWTVGVAYKVGDIVTYQGKTYRCLQGHVSQAGWTPLAVPALWQLQ